MQARLIFALLGLCAGLAQAGHPGPAEPRPLPPEAFAACEGKTEGATVQITLPDQHTMEATCRKAGEKLAALPQRMAPPAEGHREPRRGFEHDRPLRPTFPSFEAIAACVGKKDGEAITATLPDGRKLTAQCTLFDKTLALRPLAPPPGHPASAPERKQP